MKHLHVVVNALLMKCKKVSVQPTHTLVGDVLWHVRINHKQVVVRPNVQVTEMRRLNTVEDGFANMDSGKNGHMQMLSASQLVVRIGPCPCLVKKTKFL